MLPGATPGNPIYVRQETTPDGIGLIALPLLLLSWAAASRRERLQVEEENARWAEWRRKERQRERAQRAARERLQRELRRAARLEWENWVLVEKRKWREYVAALQANGLQEPRYQEASKSKYGIKLPGYPAEVVEFAEKEAEQGRYGGEVVCYGQLWQWELRPETIRRVRRMVREATQPAIPQTVLDDAFSMFKNGSTRGTIHYAGRRYRWVKTGPNKLKFLSVDPE